ncbi:MAG: tRNA threonylcarbamoyladenosine dehydratase [Bacteroidales bacterium]|nr:tRNA threonylcarbamoyladenosine dehydratase [Bacteroidales bacterium]
MTWTERTELLVGTDGLEKLSRATVAVVGVGGVGSAAAEMLSRAGVGGIVLIDNDTVSESNRNRQLPALVSTVGQTKCEVVGRRLLDINPALRLQTVCEYLSEDNIAAVLGRFELSYVVDAIDTLSPKIALIQYCLSHALPLVSSMGSGAKLDATAVRLADISKTRECPLAHQLRKRLHRLGIFTGFKAVYSEEKPRRESVVEEESRNKKSQVGTISYLPVTFGCVCAQAVITGLLSES